LRIDTEKTRRCPDGHQAEYALLIIFLFSLVLINPWIRGDGVGYYAFARAPLIEHSLDFQQDYLNANSGFREHRVDQSGKPKAFFRTRTGHLDNHFSVGPAILWAPFLVVAHGGVLVARAGGSSVAADGFSAPYRWAAAFATALYGFLGLLISYRFASQYAPKRWAALATVGVWWGSSLPVYMYFNPFWSHAHSAFTVALFLWYWHATRSGRTLRQWFILAFFTGLMLSVYFANVTLLVVLLVEAVSQYRGAFRPSSNADSPPPGALLLRHTIFCVTTLACMIPTFLSRQSVYGNAFESGYTPLREWFWRSPFFGAVLFSSNHGLFSWTPLLLFSILGLFFFWRSEPFLGGALVAATLAFYFFIASYPDWAGISSYGNRFFVSLTAMFILGLSVALERFARLFRTPAAALASVAAVLSLLVIWNLGFVYQWGAHLIASRGPISWSEMVHNQFYVVPRRLSADLQLYLFKRRDLMQQIEQSDIDQLRRLKGE